MAVHHNPTTAEPYLQLPPPSSPTSPVLRLTPARAADGPAITAAMNDPSVYLNLLGPPFPYLPEHWDGWWPVLERTTQKAREELDAVEAWRRDGARGPKRWVGAGLPFTAIREVVVVVGTEGGEEEEEVFLGEVAIRRAEGEENAAREAGDAGVEWEMGFWLCPSAQGRGVMTTVLRTLLDTFFVGYMNVHRLKGSYLEHNTGSKRVLEKCGFVYESKEENAFEVNETKTGGIKGQRVGAVHMRWVPS